MLLRLRLEVPVELQGWLAGLLLAAQQAGRDKVDEGDDADGSEGGDDSGSENDDAEGSEDGVGGDADDSVEGDDSSAAEKHLPTLQDLREKVNRCRPAAPLASRLRSAWSPHPSLAGEEGFHQGKEEPEGQGKGRLPRCLRGGGG